MKNETIFFKKWPSTGCLDAHLAKSLSEGETIHRKGKFTGNFKSYAE